MGSDDERLFDVGRLGRAGDETAKRKTSHLDSAIGFMHIVDDL